MDKQIGRQTDKVDFKGPLVGQTPKSRRSHNWYKAAPIC